MDDRLPRRLALLLMPLLVLPLAHAGSPEAPDLVDAEGDGGLDQLDLRSLWIDTADGQNLTFHLTLGEALPAVPQNTSGCADPGCAFASLTYRIIFRVLGPDGAPLPTVADYNRSYVAYRHGPGDGLASPVGFFDGKDALTLTGSAAVALDGANLTLRIPRSDPAVNMPSGPTPGTVVAGLYAYDSPQGCSPAACAPLVKPALNTTPGVDSATVVNDWDRAPDVGFAAATAFPAPPPAPAGPEPSGSASASPTAAPKPTQAPAPPAPTTVTVTQTASPSPDPLAPASDEQGKESPGPAVPLAAVALLGLALLARRRL